MKMVPALFLVSWFAFLSACGDDFDVTDRLAGERTPLTRSCDELDEGSCLLPFPSSAFLESHPAHETGLRVAIEIEALNPADDGRVLARADGFSRMSSIVTSFPRRLDPASLEAATTLFLAQHDHPDYGAEVPVALEALAPAGGIGLLVGHPRAPMEPDAEHVAVVTDALRGLDGVGFEQDRITKVQLGLVSPANRAEAELYAYHAPLRALLDARGIEPERVLRAWDFTTRSEDDPRKRLTQMRAAALAALDAGEVEVVIDRVDHRETGPIASVVEGRLRGLPNFLTEDGLSADESGDALAVGVRDAPFRLMIPVGVGDYPMLTYGHGTGGEVDDGTFDDEIAALGAAKLGIEYYGWTAASVIETFLDLREITLGASRAAAGLVQAVADASAIRVAASGALGDVLSADSLLGEPNPHAGRRPDDSVPIWVGGSLGGTMGAVFVAANQDVEHAILNVPGAGWATWVRGSTLFAIIEPVITGANGGARNLPLLLSMAQILLDEADGASWVDVLRDDPVTALLQESIGDPVLPNFGTEVLARVFEATMVGAAIVPIPSIESAPEVNDASAITQFRVEAASALDVHGFAARSGPAADAAKEQIVDFLLGAWSGAVSITAPSLCPEASCDFVP